MSCTAKAAIAKSDTSEGLKKSDATILLLEFSGGEVAVLCAQSPVLLLVFERGFFSETVFHALMNRIIEFDEERDLIRRRRELEDYYSVEDYARWAVDDGDGYPAQTQGDVDWYAEAFRKGMRSHLELKEIDEMAYFAEMLADRH